MIAASQPSPFQFYVGVASRRLLARSLVHSLPLKIGRTNDPRADRRGGGDRRGEEGRGGAAIEVVGFTGGGRGRGGASGQAARTLTLHMPVRSPYTPYLPTYLRATCVCMRNQPKVSNCRCYASNTSTTYSHLPALSYGSASPRHVRASLRPTVASSNNISGPSAN